MESSPGITIRSATMEDAKGIQKCLAAAFEPYRTQYSPGAFADTVPDDEAMLRRLQQMHVLVALENGNVAGTISIARHDERGHLRGMAVLPERRGTGVAAKLLAVSEAYLRSSGCKKVTLNTTVPLESAIRFYEKNGYQRLGNVGDFFGMPLLEYVKQL